MPLLLHRVFALALTLAMMSGPLALALCHVECDAAASHHQAAQHSCHDMMESSPASVAMTAVPHVCGHDNEAPPAGLERALRTVAAPVAVLSSGTWALAPAAVVVQAPAVPDTSPPKADRLIPLRI